MLKPEDVVTALDLDLSKYDDVKSFTEGFSADWLRRSEAPKDPDVVKTVFGTVNGTIRSRAHVALQKLGIKHERSVTESMDPTEIFDLIAEKVPAAHEAKIKELEGAIAKGGKGGEEVEKLKAQLAEAIKSKEDTLKLHEAQVGKYNELEASVKTREHEAKVSGEWDRAFGVQKYRQNASDLEKEGFVARMRKQFQVMFDETGAPYAADVEGNRIPEPGKAQKFLDLPSLIAAEVVKAGLDQKNPQGGKPVGGVRPTMPTMPSREAVPQAPGARKVHPSFGRL